MRASSQTKTGSLTTTPSLQARWRCAGGHVGTINDIAWLKQGSPSVFLTVGDDRTLKEWDYRQPAAAASTSGKNGLVRSVVVNAAGKGGVNSISTSPFHEHLLLTAGEDKLVRMWDRRNLKESV